MNWLFLFHAQMYDLFVELCVKRYMQRRVCNGGNTLELFLDLVLKCDLLLLLPSYG